MIGLGRISSASAARNESHTGLPSTAISIPVRPWGDAGQASSWRSPSPLGARLFAAAGANSKRMNWSAAVVPDTASLGVIDATLFVLNSLFYRSRHARFFRMLKNVCHCARRRPWPRVREVHGLWKTNRWPSTPEDRDRLYRSLLALSSSRHPPAWGHGARISYLPSSSLLCDLSATALPGVIPLLLLARFNLALHVSRAGC